MIATRVPGDKHQLLETLVCVWCTRLIFFSGWLELIIIFFSFLYLAKATFAAIGETFKYLTPDMWPDTKLGKPPYQEFTDYLAKAHSKPQAIGKPPEPWINSDDCCALKFCFQYYEVSASTFIKYYLLALYLGEILVRSMGSKRSKIDTRRSRRRCSINNGALVVIVTFAVALISYALYNGSIGAHPVDVLGPPTPQKVGRYKMNVSTNYR